MHGLPPLLYLLVIRSAHIERAARFYQALGLLLQRHAHDGGVEHYTSVVDTFVFEIYPLKPGGSPTTAARLGFLVNSVDELVPMVVAIGAVVVKAPHDSEWGRRAVVKDLDGHVVELGSRHIVAS